MRVSFPASHISYSWLSTVSEKNLILVAILLAMVITQFVCTVCEYAVLSCWKQSAYLLVSVLSLLCEGVCRLVDQLIGMASLMRWI